MAWSQAPPVRPARRPPQQPQPRQPDPAYAPRQAPQPYREPPRRQVPPPPPPRANRPAARPEPIKPRKRRIGKTIGLLLLVLVVFGSGSLVYFDRSLNRIDALPDYPGRIADTPGTNWLLVGSDSRTDLSPEQESELATGGDTGPDRTDTIILIHIPESGDTTMVSIPRDSYLPIPDYGEDKVNAAFAVGGPALLVQTLEEATGVRIDHYAQIGFSGFSGIVDAIGGIEVCLDEPIDDPLAGINLPAGCQKLNGPEALGFVRSRATATADLARMENQRKFMAALMAKASSPTTLVNPFRMWPLVSGTTKSLTVDEGDHIWNLAALAWALHGNTVTTTVPIAGFEETYGSGNVALWDTERAGAFFAALAADRPVPPELLTSGP